MSTAAAAMQAIVQDVYGSADVLELRDIDRPVAGDGEVLVRVRAAGVDPGVWHLMTGLPYLTRVVGFGLRKPKVAVRGRDVAGLVEAVGPGVTRFAPGDEVVGVCERGSYAEYACAKQDQLVHKPARLTFEEAAAVPVSALTALHALRDAGRLEAGQTVLIVGAGGGVGTYAVQLAKAFGAEVTGVCSTAKVDLVTSLGADATIDYTVDDFPDGVRRFDLVLVTAGNRPVSVLRRALAERGTLVLIGGEGGGKWLGGVDRVLGAVLLSLFVRQRLRGMLSSEGQEDLEVLAEMIEAGTVTPVIDRTYPLSDAPDAIRRLEEGHARGKLVITT